MAAERRIQIFRPGTHKPMEGAPISFSEDDLRASAEAYDPAIHEAPIVVGHPAGDAPAYGWVERLDYEGDHLEATPHQVAAEFAEAVRAGRYKHVSASFYSPDSPDNPKPGVLYLRHVGFLGAQPPAVKGLRPVSFAEADRGVVTCTLDFGEGDWRIANALRSVGTLFRRLRDRMVETEGLEKADAVLPDWEVSGFDRAAADIQAEARAEIRAVPAFSETTTPEETAVADPTNTQTPEAGALQAEADRLAAERKALDAERLSFAEAQARAEAATFVDALIKEGKVPPAHQAGLVSFMATLSGEAGTLSFGEGDAAKKTSPRQYLRDFLTGLPAQIDFAERSAGDGSEGDAAPSGEELARRALEFQEAEAKAGREISVVAAINHVVKEAKQ